MKGNKNDTEIPKLQIPVFRAGKAGFQKEIQAHGAGHAVEHHLAAAERACAAYDLQEHIRQQPSAFHHLHIQRYAGHVLLHRMYAGLHALDAVSAKLYSAGEKNCWLEITLDEGKNREIRRMLAKLGYEVLRLVRIKFCNFELGNLKQGEIKEIHLTKNSEQITV